MIIKSILSIVLLGLTLIPIIFLFIDIKKRKGFKKAIYTLIGLFIFLILSAWLILKFKMGLVIVMPLLMFLFILIAKKRN